MMRLITPTSLLFGALRCTAADFFSKNGGKA